MRIGIDISQIVYKGTGIGRYVENLVNALLASNLQHEFTFFCGSLRLQPDDSLIRKMNQKGRYVHLPLPPKVLNVLWNTLRFPSLEMILPDIDVFITSDWTEPPTSRIKKITIIPDLVVYKFPETSDNYIVKTIRKKLSIAVRESIGFIAISKHTKRDAHELLHIPENKISVVYPYVEAGTATDSIHDIPTPYCLAVGKIEPRKNIERLISAFEMAQIPNLTLAIAGLKGWDSATNSKFAHSKNHTPNPKIKYLGYVTDNQLFTLYKNAEFFIFPSLYEGFGYPVIEAMLMGSPVIASKTGSTGEIVEDAGRLINPLDVTDISNNIKMIHNSADLRRDLIKRGYIQAKKFNRDQFTMTFIQAIEQIMSNTGV